MTEGAPFPLHLVPGQQPQGFEEAWGDGSSGPCSVSPSEVSDGVRSVPSTELDGHTRAGKYERVGFEGPASGWLLWL